MSNSTAEQRIAECVRTRSVVLDLSDCFVRSLPELGQLTWLESLNLGSTFHGALSAREARGLAWDLRPLLTLTSLKALFLARVSWIPISFAPLRNLERLDVSNANISDLTQFKELTRLAQLSFRNTRVRDLTPLSALKELRILNATATNVSDLQPLAELTKLRELYLRETDAAHLKPLSKLTELVTLDIARTPIGDLTPLSELRNLITLDLRGCPVSDLSPIADLQRVARLDISSSRVKDLTPLAKLRHLKSLVLEGAAVSDLSPVAHFASQDSLERLDITSTHATDLSPLKALFQRGLGLLFAVGSTQVGINAAACRLTVPPMEIARQGNQAILNYLAERESAGVERLYEAKMLIVGPGGAGKTSLLRRLFKPQEPLPSEQETTKGIEIHQHQFLTPDNHPFRLNVWDFGGQEIYHATHQFFFTERSLYVLLDDTKNDNRSVFDEGFKYWLDLVENLGGRSPTLIFQNQKAARSKNIDEAGIRRRFENVAGCYAGDLAFLDSVSRLRDAIEFTARNLAHVGDELPTHWLKVRADLEACALTNPHVSLATYFEICERHMKLDSDRALHLSQYLHDLGVFLHFQDHPLLRRTLVLQNRWLTNAVYRILDDEMVKVKVGRFDRSDCERLWSEKAYADMHPELIAFMQKFELCYPLSDTGKETWLVPQLLAPARPASETPTEVPGDLVVRYRYGFLPKGLASRLTVRLHRFVRDPNLAWVTGVVFQHEANRLTVEVLSNGNEIELRARGPERKELMTVVVAELDALNESFRGLADTVDVLIPCVCAACRSEKTPHLFHRKTLQKRRRDGRPLVECPTSYSDVSVSEMLDGVVSPEVPSWGRTRAIHQARVLKVFIASSLDMQADRDALDLYIRQRNDDLRQDGVLLQVVRWETSSAAMSATRLQDEYNTAIRDCDVFVGLFFSRLGTATEEEFDVAHDHFQRTGSPRILTFFLNSHVKIQDLRHDDLRRLSDFKEKLTKLGHYPAQYEGIEHLKRQFRDELDRLPRDS